MMARAVFGKEMPAPLRSAVPDEIAEIVGYLQEVLRYCAPEFAEHGWARMCMYRASDGMDAVGHLAGLIAAQLEHDGGSHATIQRMLRVDDERLRMDTAVPLPGLLGQEQDLGVMPEWLHRRVQGSVTRVLLRLHVVLRHCRGERSRHWAARCLAASSEAMDELGVLIGTMAALHAEVMDRTTLARYQHLFQQRSRRDLPGEDDRAWLAGLLGLSYQGSSSAWYFGGRAKAGRPDGPRGEDAHEARVALALVRLGETFDGRPWEGPDGQPPAWVRCAVLSCLNGLTAVDWDDDLPALYWLPEDERRRALAVADSLTRDDRQGRWR